MNLKSCTKWCDFQILYSGASTAFPAEIGTVYYLNSSKKQLTLQASCSLLQRRICVTRNCMITVLNHPAHTGGGCTINDTEFDARPRCWVNFQTGFNRLPSGWRVISFFFQASMNTTACWLPYGYLLTGCTSAVGANIGEPHRERCVECTRGKSNAIFLMVIRYISDIKCFIVQLMHSKI